MKRFIWTFLLAGCTSQVELSPRVEEAYQEFLANPQREAFAVSEDGLVYGYSVCEFDKCWGSGTRVAIELCESRGYRKCVVYE